MKTNNNTIGIALGGGGVRGLAHVAALEAIDAYGITPTAIAGTSMGAIIGAFYASGKSASEIRSIIKKHIIAREDGIKDIYAKKDSLKKWFHSVRLARKGSGLLDADGFLRHLIKQMNVTKFEELKIPLHVFATDFHSGESVVFDSGPLLPALKASMSVPGIFVPVEYENKILVDGGVSNNLPYYILLKKCDKTIAIDVAITRKEKDASPPNMIDATIGMFDIMMERITKNMIETHPPSIYFHPRLVGIRMLDFNKAEDVFSQMEQELEKFKQKLERQIT